MVLSFVLLLWDKIWNLVIVHRSIGTDIISVSFCVFGLFLCLWAREVLAGNWNIGVVLKKKHELIKTGPYSYVRHPIYSGLIFIFFGTALAIGKLGGFIGLIVLIISLWFKLRDEEKLMIEYFGKRYLDSRQLQIIG